MNSWMVWKADGQWYRITDTVQIIYERDNMSHASCGAIFWSDCIRSVIFSPLGLFLIANKMAIIFLIQTFLFF